MNINMKWSFTMLSVVALFAVMFFTSTAWAQDGRGYEGGRWNYSRPRAVCTPQRGGYVEKRVVTYQRPVVQKRVVEYRQPVVWNQYHREYVNQNQTVSTAVQKGNNGNHYGWYQNQSNNHANLTADQQAKAKEFFEKQKSDKKSFMDSLKSRTTQS